MQGSGAMTTGVLVLEREFLAPRRPWWRTAGRLAVRKPLGTLSAVIIVLLVVAALGAPVVARYDSETIVEDCSRGYCSIVQNGPPTGAAWFGTDFQGHDNYARIVWGSQRSLEVGLLSLTMGTVIGVFIALISAYARGNADLIIQRFMDAFQAFPPLLFLILMVTMTEANIRNLIIALGIIAVPSVSRIVRSVILQVREMPYVEAARVIGASAPRIMARHILPNIMAPIIIVFSIGIGVVILAEASLSFLLLAPPGVSWGQMLAEGRQFLLVSPWQALFSGMAITLAVLGFNLAGDALRDILDPRLRV
ncbi:MAG: ABC transporter permease [Chloroflexota bacterium]|nr:ABC transporter permease [Chloroflexota bacterium]